ncbi:MAG: hypothetical protein IJV44_05580 [Prevotella sp.]|nr:hypothetical protein [Prevotella sp.]
MNKKIQNRKEYDAVKERVDALIAEATAKGMLEPEADNEYTQEIAQLSELMAIYEDEELDILPLREKSPLIRCIEDYFYSRNLHQKDGARILGINESVFSQVMCGKRKISMSLAKRLHSRLGIDAKLILENA